MNFEMNLREIDLQLIKKSDIKTFRDFAVLVHEVRLAIGSTRDLDVVYRHYDALNFLIKNFPLNMDQSQYFKSKTDVDIKSSDLTEELLAAYHEDVSGINERDIYHFNAEFQMRPFEATFNFEANLKKPRFGSKYVSEETFKGLVNKFWYFVEWVNKNQYAEV